MAHPAHLLFLPHPHNNHKAKILWPRSIMILVGIFLMGRSFIDMTIALRPGVLGYASQIDPEKIIQLTNAQRLNAGLETVKENRQLDAAALAKVSDMFSKGYWAHVSPTGTEPWYFITQSGYKYQHAGENLARDFSNPKDIVAAWMASPTHRQNLLDSRYKDIGIAVMDGYINGIETTIVVQMFGTLPQSAPKVASANIRIPQVQAEEKQAITTNVEFKDEVSVRENNVPASGMSPLDLSRVWSLAFVIMVLFALSLDWIFVYRYNLIRISGKTWAHLTYFVGVAAIVVIIRQGIVL